MSDFMIIIDSMADLPDEYIKEHKLGLIHLTYYMDGAPLFRAASGLPHSF